MQQDQSRPIDPDEAVTPLEVKVESATEPFLEFIQSQKSSSLFLLLCTILALFAANFIPAQYFHVIETPVGLLLGEHTHALSAKHFVNDGLMALFFFLLGLEIKREFIAGHLKEAAVRNLIIFASLGGMVFPALIYCLMNLGEQGDLSGWGIPMATDTAFAIGVLALLGAQAPRALFSFLVAYAIIDDLGAILIIALFYSESLVWSALGMAGSLFVLLCLLNAAGFRHPLIYAAVGFLLWLSMLQSGVHATLAGILVALAAPARPRHGASWLQQRLERVAEHITQPNVLSKPVLENEEHHLVLSELEKSTRLSMTPLQRWEKKLDTPVGLLVMPIFALFNAGVVLSGDSLSDSLAHPVGLGILLGLLLGKPLGIFLMSWMALRLGWGQLPGQLNLWQVAGLGLLGGIGFTMSIFISNLAFVEQVALVSGAKIAILSSSLLAALGAFFILRHSLREQQEGGA